MKVQLPVDAKLRRYCLTLTILVAVPATFPFLAAAEHGAEAGSGIRLLLQLVSGGGDQNPAVTVRLLPAGGGRAATAAAGAAEMAGEVAADSSYDSDSSDSDSSGSDSAASSESEEDEEPLDLIENYADIKKMIDGMDADADLDGGGDGGGGGNGVCHLCRQQGIGALLVTGCCKAQQMKEG